MLFRGGQTEKFTMGRITHSTCTMCTENPRISPLVAYLFLLLFGWGLIRGGLIILFDKCRIKSSLPKLLFSILLQEQSIFKH